MLKKIEKRDKRIHAKVKDSTKKMAVKLAHKYKLNLSELVETALVQMIKDEKDA